METKTDAQIAAIMMTLSAVISSLPPEVATRAGQRLTRTLDEQQLEDLQEPQPIQLATRRDALLEVFLAQLSDAAYRA